MTKVMLFFDPIAAAFMAFAAYATRHTTRWAAFDAVMAIVFAGFWLLLLNAYADRVRAEARLEQATRDAELAGGRLS